MEPTFQPLVPAPIEPVAPVAVAPVETKPRGVRRAILTAAISGLLLVAGGVAVVSAASPEPSASPSTVAPSDGTTTAPSNGGTTTPRTHTGTKADCPNMGGGTTVGGSGGSSTTPSTTPSTAPTPAT